MKKKIIKFGGSVGVTITPAYLEILNAKIGDTCDVELDFDSFPEEKRIIITFPNKD